MKVIEATSGSDGRIKQMALGIIKLSKSLAYKDADYHTHTEAGVAQSIGGRQSENPGSSKIKYSEAQEHQQKQDMQDWTMVQNVLCDSAQLTVGSLLV